MLFKRYFIFYALWFGSCFLLLVLFVCSLNNEVVLFCVCVVCFLFCNKTKWFYCLHLVVLFSFVVLFLEVVFHSSQKKKPINRAGQKPPKQVCSVVFTNSVPNFWGMGLKVHFAENTIESGFNIFCKSQNGQNCRKGWVKNLVQGWVKTWSKHVAQHKWIKFWLKNGNLCLAFSFLTNLILPAERRINLKNNRKKENLDQVLTQQKQSLDHVLTLCPLFGLFDSY